LSSSTLRKKRKGFTMVMNDFINDSSFPSFPKFLYIFMESKPDGWQFSLNGLVSQMYESKPTIIKALNTLIELGYLEKIKKRVNGKQVANDYILHDVETVHLKKSNNKQVPQELEPLEIDILPSSSAEDNNEEIKTFLDLKKFLVKYNKNYDGEQFIFQFGDEQVSISNVAIPYFRTGKKKNENLSFEESDLFYKSCLNRKDLLIAYIRKNIVKDVLIA